MWVHLYFPPFPHFCAPCPIVPHSAHLWLDLHFGLVQPAPLKQLPCKGCSFPTWVPSTDPLHIFCVEDCWPRNWNPWAQLGICSDGFDTVRQPCPSAFVGHVLISCRTQLKRLYLFFAYKINTDYFITKQVVWTFRKLFFLQFDTKFASKQQRLAKIDTILWFAVVDPYFASLTRYRQDTREKRPILPSTHAP